MKRIGFAIVFLTVFPTFGITTILNEGFENPRLNPSNYPFVSGSAIPGWKVIDDTRGEHPYLVNESKWANLGIELFGDQALVLNEGSGIETTVPILFGQTYTFSIWGFGNLALPLHIDVGNVHFDLNFGHWTAGGLQERSFTFTANQTDDAAVVRILNSSFGYDFRQRIIDNISLTTTSTISVPDAGSSALLLGLGIVGIVAAQLKEYKRIAKERLSLTL